MNIFFLFTNTTKKWTRKQRSVFVNEKGGA